MALPLSNIKRGVGETDPHQVQALAEALEEPLLPMLG